MIGDGEEDGGDENTVEEKKKSAVGDLLQSHGYAFAPNQYLKDLDSSLLRSTKKSSGFRAPDF